MKRDFVCILRILVDLLPKSLRNSKLLFNFARIFFGIPKSLFAFREKYDSGNIKNLSIYYFKNSDYSLKRIAKETDVNSFHLRLIKNLFKSKLPDSFLDVGCGSGYILEELKCIKPTSKFIGIDYQVPQIEKSEIDFIEGEILESLKGLLTNSFEFVICTHVLEHLESPKEIVIELKRICSNVLILICPLEKKYKWGLNYHINFFPSKDIFINFVRDKNDKLIKNSKSFKTFIRLGDLMYVENFE